MDISGSVALVIGSTWRHWTRIRRRHAQARCGQDICHARDTASLANAQPTRRNLRGCRNQMTEHDATSDHQAFGQE